MNTPLADLICQIESTLDDWPLAPVPRSATLALLAAKCQALAAAPDAESTEHQLTVYLEASATLIERCTPSGLDPEGRLARGVLENLLERVDEYAEGRNR